MIKRSIDITFCWMNCFNSLVAEHQFARGVKRMAVNNEIVTKI